MTIFFIFMVLVMLISTIVNERKRKKEQIILMRESFGKKPEEDTENLQEIGIFWDEYKELLPDDEKVDSVTWDDLEMDDIFNRINMCCSFVGEQYLYSCLHTLPKAEYHNTKLESMIKSLTENTEDRVEIQKLLAQMGRCDVGYYVPMFVNHLENYKIGNIGLYRFLQVLLVLSLFPPLIFMNPLYLAGTLTVFMINLVTYTLKKITYETYLSSLFNIIKLVKIAKKLSNLEAIKGKKEFQELEKSLGSLSKMSHLMAGVQKRKNASLSGDAIGMFYDFAIGATFWDFTIYDKICKILDSSRADFWDLYKVVGEMDAAISIASFRKSLPKYCIPQFVDGGQVQGVDIYHPFIEEPVYNSFDMNSSCFITGSNASGKSTFVKAVALNVVLAQCINTCTAKKLEMSRAWVITSMAVRDDLMQGESYYIKEIKYLNRIIVSLKPQRLVFCVIDEILKGTNYEERIAASYSILEYLSEKNCLALVATHDKELTVLLDGVYDNYHFEEQINEKDITFDYQIRKGSANTRNAIKLLEYVGFPKEIIEKALKYIHFERDEKLNE